MIDLNPYRRIEDDLQQLAQYTEEPTRKGVTRRLYSPQWAAAQRHLVQLMRGEGLNPWVDAVGNVHGRIEGRSRHTILTGSHFDTVRGGGAYDGVYGVVAGIFALSQIKKRCRVPEKSLEVVAFCEEEGSRFPMTCLGSRAILGAWQPEEVARLVDDQGTSLFEAMQMNGLDWRSMGEANRSDYEAYIELHVEQGPELEDAQCAIGVVSEIFGQERWLVSVRGDSAHAGTTPLARRQDALVAASAMVLAINTLGYRYEPIGIATVGILEVIHGSINCVPGHVQFSVDFRAAQDSVRQRLADEIGINNALFEMVAQQLRDRASYVRDGSPQGLVASGETAEGYPVIREGVWYGEIILVRRRKPLGMALSAAIHAIALLRAKQYWSMQQLYVQQRQWIEGMTREGSLTPVSTLTSPFRFDHVLFKGPYGAMVVHVQTGPGFQRMGNHWNQRVSLLDETAQWLQMFLTQKGWGLILASDDDELVGIASPGSKSMEGDDFSWNYRQLEEASQALWAHFHVKVSFHLGRLYPSASHLPLSLQEAREVAKTLTNHVINVYQARSLQALLRQIAPEDRARFVTEVFGPLLTLSEPERAVLLETMDIFFENQNQASEAAKALYVHRNTVLYRIRKLEDLLHRSLSDAEDLLTVRVALLFLKELDLREGAPRHDMY
ncbi:hydantoinase/carbamoylase family amidase [Sulfobacillus thermotolerans]|uniref:hydantoinase/carbamoylase family amidase n=1 Tax=Sulfobacillus thermotolerans TaxID=338644 RepID=UPI0033677E7D